jgi:YbgC/YbaW family acyl-CoA thioester hydrolase
MVYAGRYHEFCEDAFLDMLEHVGAPYRRWRQQGVDLVISEAHYRYHRPAHLDDDLSVAVTIEVTTEFTLTARFEVGNDSQLLATATIHYAAVRDGRRCPVPDELSRVIAAAALEPEVVRPTESDSSPYDDPAFFARYQKMRRDGTGLNEDLE